MVALRRFFHAEKTPSTPASDDRESQTQSPIGRPLSSASLAENEKFQNIERQFEVLHDQLKARPAHIPLARASSHLTRKNPGHVDLLDALFSSHRYQGQMQHPPRVSPSPISPYNEDVAERNMAPFLRPKNGRKRHSRIISALYQEDVADRNMAKNVIQSRRRSRSLSRGTSRLTSHSYQLDFQGRGDSARGRSRSSQGSKESQLVNSISQEALYSVPKSYRDQVAAESEQANASAEGFLRTHRSAPTVLPDQNLTPTSEGSVSPHLGVPPAHKQGDSWTNRPLPDSPTLPTVTSVRRTSTETRRQQDSRNGSTPSTRLPNASNYKRPGMASRAGSKKNILDLSINTELAARGRPKKIAHKAIQPPTPSNLDGKKNPTIAEIMNSPLPVATPSPSPLPSSNKKVTEIMDMFRKAYTSTTQDFAPHPTFETLQDAIIREINSHEVFQRVPFPEQGPPFTPSSSQESFDESATPPNPIALKDGQRRRRRSSFKRSWRNSDVRKSISTSDPADASRQELRQELDVPNHRRQHTDAPPPSPGFFDTLIPQHPDPPSESVTYMDLLLRSDNTNNVNPRQSKATSVSDWSGHRSSTTPSVLYMRAQSSTSDDGSLSFDDSDSDIIHLPSAPGIPKVKISGVDENDVTYATENTTTRNAYRLMNWPRKSSRSVNLRTTFAKNRTVSGQSVASY
ncbi:hypothetical protein BDV19DRAFT_352806 [Aspergillus venezuelensis]